MLKEIAAPAAVSCLIWTSAASAATIDFEDGAVDGDAIGTSYSALGVEFQNATWTQTGEASSGAFALTSGADGPLSPIVATFAGGITLATLTALNVGTEGVRIDAYDALTGGTLVASDEVYGLGSVIGIGLPLGTDETLTVSNPSIFRIELTQPGGLALSGLNIDDFSFQPIPAAVPVPAAGVLLLSALGMMGIIRRRKGEPEAA